MLEEHPVTEDDAWSAASHNDTLSQDEYLDQLRRSQLDPEKRLMLAILQDAVSCYQRNLGAQQGRRRQLFLEVEGWIKSDDSDHLFSFANICETLGIHPDYLSRGLFQQWAPGSDRPAIRHLRLEAGSRRARPRRPRASNAGPSV